MGAQRHHRSIYPLTSHAIYGWKFDLTNGHKRSLLPMLSDTAKRDDDKCNKTARVLSENGQIGKKTNPLSTFIFMLLYYINTKSNLTLSNKISVNPSVCIILV